MERIFQADADDLQQISMLFYQSASLAEEAMQDLQWHTETLASAWIGEGASAFFGEMEQRILPFLKSLSEGLTACNSQINTLMKHTVDTEQAIRGRLSR